jgi:hypothetical protein
MSNIGCHLLFDKPVLFHLCDITKYHFKIFIMKNHTLGPVKLAIFS